MFSWVTVPRATLGSHNDTAWRTYRPGSRYRYVLVSSVTTPVRDTTSGTKASTAKTRYSMVDRRRSVRRPGRSSWRIRPTGVSADAGAVRSGSGTSGGQCRQGATPIVSAGRFRPEVTGMGDPPLPGPRAG